MKMIRIGSLSVAVWHVVKLELCVSGRGLHVHLQAGEPVWVQTPEGVTAEALRDALEVEIGEGAAIRPAGLLLAEELTAG